MVNDQIKVTHDNNGRFYRIKMDLAKEGSEIWDLTPYFKGRVGDNRFGLQVVWTYQGRLLDTTGMKPYIEGNVGNYSFDDKKDLQLAPDAATVRYTGNPSDCQSGGRVTYYFPEQMFPRDGIFKGYIGLLDDRDDSSQPHISGVTVWFRVLPGIAQMGHACDVYISDLDKALQNFKVKIDQHDKDYQTQLQQVIDDARNAYESETKNAHDSLDALKAQIQANRDGQASIAEQQAAIIRQIKDQDIVTKTDYDNNIKTISESINERLAQMKTAPVGVADAQTLRNTYPNGADGIFLALDTKHIWMWLNGQWTDGGVYQSAGLDKAVQQSIGDTKSILLKENLIPNGSFADGNTAPAWGNSGNESLSLFDFLNRTWLNVSSSSQAPYQGVAWTFKNPALTSGIMYPLHIEFDLITQDSMKLSLDIIGIDADGNRIGGPSGGVVVDTISTEIWQMKHESIDFEFPPSLASASSITIQLTQPDSKVISTLRITGLSAHFVLPENNRELNGNLIDNNLLKKGINNNASVNVSGDISIYKNLAGQNWIQLSNTNTDAYNGLKWTIDNPLKVLAQNAPLEVSFDLMSAENTNININIIPNTADDKVMGSPSAGVIVDSFTTTTWRAYHEHSIALLPDDYVNADKLVFQIVQPDAKAIQMLRVTNISLKPVYEKETNDRNSLFKPDLRFGAQNMWGNAWAKLSFYQYLGRNWVCAKTTTPNAFSGISFHVKNYSDFYNSKLKIDFDILSEEDTILQVDALFNDSNDHQTGAQAFTQDLEVQASRKMHYTTIVTLDPSNKSADYFVFQIIQYENKVLKGLSIADVEIKPYFDLVEEKSQETEKNILPVVSISGDMSGMTHDNAKNVTYEIKKGDTYISGYATLKWQGSSSTTLPKKAYRLKTTKSDFQKKNKIKVIPSWDYHHRFNIKAYYNDGLLSRDPVAAQVGGAIWSQRNDLPKDLVKEDNFGFIDGFPILLYINNQFQGVYSFNLPRPEFDYTKWAIMGAEYNDITEFKNVGAEGVKLDGSDFESLNPEDTPTAEEKTAVTELIRWVINSSDEEFKNNLDKHFNINSLVDYVVFTNIVGARDAYGKNQILMTWDGKIWYYQSYDLDCIYNANWMGGKTFESPQVGDELYFGSNNNLFVKFSRLFKDKIAQRYQEVRQWCTPDYILRLFKARVDQIGQDNFQREWSVWNDPSKDTEDFKQLRLAVYDHFKVADAVWLKK